MTNGTSKAVSVYYQETESFSSASGKTNIQSSLGATLGNLSRTQAVTVVDGVITCTITNISSEVDGVTAILTPATAEDGSISWVWSESIKPHSVDCT
jgi:Pilin (bacterial filament)